ncbi:MAG: FixH family protein [Chitinophagaceae bacterium]|nr:FixH family protein [Chitinophagaceae bacterium]
MIYKTTQSHFDLVSKDYYKDELAYQQVIDGTNLANKLSSGIQVQQQNDQISIQFPQEMKQKKAEGTIFFYCSADSGKDKKINIQLSEEAVQIIPAKDILPGKYVLKINWKTDNQNYYNEQPVSINE